MKFHLVIFFSILRVVLFGQNISVYDKSDNAPISYAHVLFSGNSNVLGGTYTDDHGKASLNIPDGVDSIKISCIGYVERKFGIDILPEIITLERRLTILDEIEVKPLSNALTTQLGYEKSMKSQSHRANSGYQLITLIDNPFHLDREIKSFVFYVRKSLTNKTARCRLLFFKNDNNLPGEEINVEVIIDMSMIESKKIEFNLESYHLVLPKEGFFVGIEWIGCMEDSIHQTPNKLDECDLAVMVNWKNESSNEHIMLIRNLFLHKEWIDYNSNNAETQETNFPAFSLIVYD